MPTTDAAAAAMRVKFTMPKPELGQVVYFRRDNTSPPAAAVVTEIGERGLSLAILVPGAQNNYVRDGVHHITDPMLNHGERAKNGNWDFSPRDKAIDALLRELKGSQNKG